MTLKNVLKNVLKYFNYEIVNIRGRKKPSVYDDLQLIFDNSERLTIIDIGAHHGMISRNFINTFPNSLLHSIEASLDSFLILKENLKHYRNINFHNLAISDRQEQLLLNNNVNEQTNSILDPIADSNSHFLGSFFTTTNKTLIDAVSLKYFCAYNNILDVDILKLDVQGLELKILHASIDLLKSQSIKVIYLEVAVIQTYKNQPLYFEIFTFLESLHYSIYNIYNKYYSKSNHKLLQFDVLFVSKNVNFKN